MSVTRLTYYSQNHIDPAAGSVVATLASILAASNRNNRPLGLTGALVFDDQWFLQVLEGERKTVWRTFERIRDDERHADVTVAEVVETDARIFGTWWMGLAIRNAKTEHVFAAFSTGDRLDPTMMSAAQMLALMVALSRLGLTRELSRLAA